MIQEIKEYPFEINEILELVYESLIEIEDDIKRAIDMNNSIELFKKYQIEDYKAYIECCSDVDCLAI